MNNGADQKSYRLKLIGLGGFINIEYTKYVILQFLYYHPLNTTDWIGKWMRHRGLKLDGAIGQGEICNSLKIENFSKSFLSHIGKNKIKF